MHNNIMAAGSRDHPLVLTTGRYAQWQSRFLRYIEIRSNGDALRKCILEGPYIPFAVTIPAVPAIDDSPEVPKRTAVETLLNMSPENKDHYQSENNAIHLLLTGIGDEIYSTVDACKTTHDMWIAIERLQQGESLNIQDVKTNLFWEFRKFTSLDGESIKSYYSRFYKMMNEMKNDDLDTVSYHKLFDVLKQYQKEANEIRAERIAKNATPLALVATSQEYPNPYYQAPKSHKSYATPSKQSSSTISHASTKYKGKEIAKPITPPFETSSNSRNKNVDTSPRYKNDNQTGQFGNQRTLTVAGAKEIVGSQDTDEEIDEQEMEAHYSYMSKIHEVLTAVSGTNTEHLEKVDSNVIPDSPDMCDNDIQTDQNAEECDTPYDTSDPVNRFVPDREETLTLEKESRSKLNKDLVKPYDYIKQNSLYEIFKPASQEYHDQLAHANEYVEYLENEINELEYEKAYFSNMYDLLLQECVSQDVMCSYLHSLSDLDAHTKLQCLYLHKVKECECLTQKLSKQTETVSKEVYNELSRSFAKLEKHSISLELALQQCQDQMKNDTNIAISELKKLIKKCKGKSVETKFDKPSVARQPNAQRILKPSVLGKPNPFSDSFERKSFSKTKLVPKTNVSEGLSKSVTSQRVIHRSSVSRPSLKSTQMNDKVMPKNSQVKFKKTEVEDHHRISSNSNKTKSVTACNDNLKSRTSNLNVVCATYEKCVLNSNHDTCVTKFINDVNARTKKPKVVHISARKPKSQVNKSVTTPPKKIVAPESTIQKSKSYYRMLYEKTRSALQGVRRTHSTFQRLETSITIVWKKRLQEIVTELTLEESLRMFMDEIAKRHDENSNLIKEIKASTDFALRNQQAMIKALEIQVKQMSIILHERLKGNLQSLIEIKPRVNDETISTSVKVDKPVWELYLSWLRQSNYGSYYNSLWYNSWWDLISVYTARNEESQEEEQQQVMVIIAWIHRFGVVLPSTAKALKVSTVGFRNMDFGLGM
ncbi:hypothetical protein Tco_0487387 [Tanacetum coccineum]